MAARVGAEGKIAMKGSEDDEGRGRIERGGTGREGKGKVIEEIKRDNEGIRFFNDVCRFLSFSFFPSFPLIVTTFCLANLVAICFIDFVSLQMPFLCFRVCVIVAEAFALCCPFSGVMFSKFVRRNMCC